MSASSILVPSAGIYTTYTPEPVQPASDGLPATAKIPSGTAGMSDQGAAPADKRGTVLMWGHVETAFVGLASTVPHGAIYVRDAEGRLTSWQVTSIYTEPRSSTHPDLFTLSGPHRLALVTCGGPIRDGHYSENVIILAQETP